MSRIIRKATSNDKESIFTLVTQFTTSFKPDYDSFTASFQHLISNESACLLVAENSGDVIGYCLGFDHYAFYANGRVSWVEEITVQSEFRREKIGSLLMDAFEAWAQARGSTLIALATRRAAPFYLALGYEESATYFRKLL